MIGARPSALPVARYCGLAPELGRRFPGANRSAFLSKVFHALCAAPRDKATLELIDALSDKERAEIRGWRPPADCQPERGPLLRYSEAEKELTLGITEYFESCSPSSEECMTAGTLDFCWLVTAKNGLKVVFVGDIKRTRFTAVDGPRSLQLICYCLMAAAYYRADAYCPGLWIAEDGEWNWSGQVTKVESRDALADMRAARAAALNKGEATTGSHCDTHCYERLHCPEYTAPPNDSALSPALEQQLTEDNALGALIEAQRLKKVADLALDNIKAAVSRGLVVSSEDGSRRFADVLCKGRKSFNQELARKELGAETIDAYITEGPGYSQFRWLKTKG